jgi:hypothetical protein
VGKKHSLPIADAPRSPTVDAARKRLGGRGESDPGAGDLVAFDGDRLGVVLFARGDDLEVWIDDGLVRRVRRGETRAADAVVSKQLASIADAARAFADLAEGTRVRFRDEVRTEGGTLVEKCRFGALIEREDGSIVAVGFRRVSAAETN